MAGVFISYRKEDTGTWAITVRDHLARLLGERQVFLDVDSLAAGLWRSQLIQALDQCAVVVLLVGRSWSGITDAEGRKRLFLADDVHRQELAMALGRRDLTIVPVLVDGARLPHIDELPPDLQRLVECQAVEIGIVRDLRLAGLRRLAAVVEELVGQRRERRRAAVAALTSGIVALINTVVVSDSLVVAVAFSTGSAVLLLVSVASCRRMVQEQMTGAWIAVVAVTLSAALFIGSIARVVLPIGPFLSSPSGI